MKKFNLILAAVLSLAAVSCGKDEPEPVPAPVCASVSINGHQYSYPKLSAAFYYSADCEGYNIVLAPENLEKIINDAVDEGKDVGEAVNYKSSALLGIDIPEGELGKSHAFSSDFNIDSDSWVFYLEFWDKVSNDHFYNWRGECKSYKSGTMRVDLNRETGRLTIALNAVIEMDEGPDVTYMITFGGTAVESSEYIW